MVATQKYEYYSYIDIFKSSDLDQLNKYLTTNETKQYFIASQLASYVNIFVQEQTNQLQSCGNRKIISSYLAVALYAKQKSEANQKQQLSDYSQLHSYKQSKTLISVSGQELATYRQSTKVDTLLRNR